MSERDHGRITVTWSPGWFRTLLISSTNQHKIRELREIASRFELHAVSPLEARERLALGPWPAVEEGAETYRENAELKARAFAAWSGLPSLADDSGLEVAALNGGPGVRSARYGGDGASDRDRWEKLLSELRVVQARSPSPIDRSALFRCALALVDSSGAAFESEGVITGHVLEHPQGSGGFGYDPIIHIDELGCTLAETPFEITVRRGFRARAAEALFSRLVG